MTTKRAASSNKAQRAQQKLVEIALKQPGVAEATAVYESARRFVPPPSAPASPARIYGTGGNAQ